jgi:signal peptide peptidase SppA
VGTIKDYARIMSKIYHTPWLITEEGLTLILDIVDRRIAGNRLTDEELSIMELESEGKNEPTIINGVGVLPLFGPIFGKANLMTEFSGATSLESFQKDFNALLENDAVKSILLDVDSPGGTSDMVDEMAKEIRAGREIKPINALANTTMGSAAYYLASQANKVYSTPSGSVGSIGAYTVHEDRSAADAQQGHRYTFISAGKYKTEGNPHEPLSQEGAGYRQEVINEVYDEFITAVAAGRGISKEKVISDFGQGRMYRPKKAFDAGMIDGISSYDALIAESGDSKPVSIAIGAGTALREGATLKGIMTGDKLTIDLSEQDYEFADPGQAPDPNRNKDDSADSGSRIDTPPAGEDGTVPNRSDTVETRAREEEGMSEFDIAALRALLGVDEDADVMAHITAMQAELGPLRELQKEHAERKRFSEEYPAEYERMQKLEAKDRESESRRFRESLNARRLMKNTGAKDDEGNFVAEPTTLGLSSLAIEDVTNVVTKFSDGTVKLEDFTGAIDAIFNSGIVDYGNMGSEFAPELKDDPKPKTFVEGRKAFSELVNKIQEEDKLETSAAIAEAARRNPDLYDMWQSGHAVR